VDFLERLRNADVQPGRVATKYRYEYELDFLTLTPDSKANGLTHVQIGKAPPTLPRRDRDVIDSHQHVIDAQHPRGLNSPIQYRYARLDGEAMEISAAVILFTYRTGAAHALDSLDANGARQRSILRARRALRLRLLHRGSHECDTGNDPDPHRAAFPK
jgi:hypothetical protein